MSSIPSITEAEWTVMKVLWDAGDWLNAGEIIHEVSADRPTHHRTVRTELARLVKKGAVEAKDGGASGGSGGGVGYRYRAKVPRDAVVRAESRSFLARLFDGNAAPALVHLLQDSRNKLSREELQQLRELLQKKKEES